MDDPLDLGELLFAFCWNHCPAVIDDEALYAGWLRFLHALVSEAARKERVATARRLLRPSLS